MAKRKYTEPTLEAVEILEPVEESVVTEPKDKTGRIVVKYGPDGKVIYSGPQ